MTGPAPFLTYLTIFQSRLGSANLVLSQSGDAYQTEERVARRVAESLREEVEIETSSDTGREVLDYLAEKRLLTSRARKAGRFQGVRAIQADDGMRIVSRNGEQLSTLRVGQVDLWFADHRLPSTIGTPTPDNATELLALVFGLKLLIRGKSTWSSAGRLAVRLRERFLTDVSNPYVMGVEQVLLLRQLLEFDGLLIKEILRSLPEPGKAFRRDDMLPEFASIAARAQARAEARGLPATVLREGAEFVRLVERAATRVGTGSGGPGVLEHRFSPRLEWLTDLGALSKQGLARNSFQYKVTSDAASLADALGTEVDAASSADEAALGYWRSAAHFRNSRERVTIPDLRAALLEGYDLMRLRIGPTSIREVCFAASVLAGTTATEARNDLLEWASADKAVAVSGGRFSREPEVMYIR